MRSGRQMAGQQRDRTATIAVLARPTSDDTRMRSPSHSPNSSRVMVLSALAGYHKALLLEHRAIGSLWIVAL